MRSNSCGSSQTFVHLRPAFSSRGILPACPAPQPRSRSPPRCSCSPPAARTTATPRPRPRPPRPRRRRRRRRRTTAGGCSDGVKLVSVGRFDTPVYVTAPPGDTRRIFVVEQGGTIRVVRGGKRVSRPFLDLRSKVIAGGEQGLLSMAFAPDYATTRRFYVNYTDRSGTQSVVEYRRSPSSRDRALTSGRLVLRYDGEESNHNGGLVTFGPDRLLYIGTGDGGGANDQHGARGNAQDLGSLLGKLLRIDPRRSGEQALQDPVEQPVREPLGRARRDLQLRAAQPVALLVRSLDRRPVDRRRRPGRDRGDRLRDEGRGERRELRLAPVRGQRPDAGHQRRRGRAGPRAAGPRAHPRRRQLLGHRRLRRARQGRARRSRAATSTATSARASCARRGCRPGSASGDAAIPGVAKVEQLSSFGEDARGRVYVTSLGGAVYRFAAG